VIALRWWYSADQTEGRITRTAAEIDAVLDALAEIAREDWPALAEVTQVEAVERGAAMMYVGLHGDLGTLTYSGPDHREGSYSYGDSPVDGEPIDYMMGNSDTELPPNCEIPTEVVRRAVHEFAETGQRPVDVPWRPVRVRKTL
jgi:immunity protein Imm1 of predicted polymorphic toxin system